MITNIYGHPSGQAFGSAVEFANHLQRRYATDADNPGLGLLQKYNQRSDSPRCLGFPRVVLEEAAPEEQLAETEASVFMLRAGKIVRSWPAHGRR
jgi:hypothetical protein